VKRPARVLSAVALAMLVACGGGGGGDEVWLQWRFGGTVSGNNCFNGVPESATVSYVLRVNGTTSGHAATLLDTQGQTWTGTVGENGSVELRQPAADTRWMIQASDAFSGGPARFDVTASCVSFRCCTTLSGTLELTGR
jgi:hypothetical protein